jgi:hypothetical protein
MSFRVISSTVSDSRKQNVISDVNSYQRVDYGILASKQSHADYYISYFPEQMAKQTLATAVAKLTCLFQPPPLSMVSLLKHSFCSYTIVS